MDGPVECAVASVGRHLPFRVQPLVAKIEPLLR
jgi:hypothetical protein